MAITKKLIDGLIVTIQNLYLTDDIPWMIGYSGGKDSTAAVQLVWMAIEQLPERYRKKTIYIMNTDTLVESPVVSKWVDKSLKFMKDESEKKGLPFVPIKLIPDYNNTFWVNLIGRGYPFPRKKYRWCTDRLKIQPVNNFIKNTWNDIEAKYIDIKEFYAEDELSFNKTWDGFEKEGEIDLLIKNYKTVRNANVLPQILTVKFEEIVPKLNKCHNEIAKLHSSEIKIFDEVKDCFDEFLANYNKTKKAMLEKIAKTHPELQNDIDSIYDSENGTLATIVNGLGPLSDFMNSISDETLDTMLEDKNKTQQIFEDIMKKSGLETEINWLQQKESLELTPSDLDHDYLRKLLESGLIKLSYTKEY